MKYFRSHLTFAPGLQVDDWIKCGGSLYRVKAVEALATEIELKLFQVANPKIELLMYCDMKQIFKVYNQK